MITITEKEISSIPVLELVDDKDINNPLPLAFFYHGWQGCKEKVLTQGYELAKRGMRVVLPDMLYHGQRADDKNHTMDFFKIILNNVQEFPSIVDEYRSLNLIKDNKIGVSGLSMGGITTCALFTTYPWITGAVCLEGSPAITKFAEALLKIYAKQVDIPKEWLDNLMKHLNDVDLELHPEKIADRPLHFWHGTKDEMVPYDLTYNFYKDNKNLHFAKDMTMETTVGAGHKVSYPTTVDMADRMKKYLS